MPIYELDGARPQIEEGSWIAPDAVLVGKIRVRKGASIWFGAVLRGDNEVITVGEDSNVQDHSILHADPGQPVEIGRAGDGRPPVRGRQADPGIAGQGGARPHAGTGGGAETVRGNLCGERPALCGGT